MRRSEMLQLIVDSLQRVDRLATTDEENAQYILTLIESFGMIPPTIEFTMGQSKVRDNGWEDEEK